MSVKKIPINLNWMMPSILKAGSDCQDQPQCRDLTRNYGLNVINGAASKLAEQLASVKLVFPWLLASIGAPAFLIGLLVPLRQAGALLPQLLISGQIRTAAIRKWFWVVTALFQVLVLFLIITGVWVVDSRLAAFAIPAMILLYSVARGIGSIAFQDVTAKTIPKGVRGRLLASRSAIGGLLTIGTGLILNMWLGDGNGVGGSLFAIVLAALLWSVAAAAFAAIKETPGTTARARNVVQEVRSGIQLVKSHTWYARYLLVRILLLAIEMAIPFYVLYGRQILSDSVGALGLLVMAAGLSQALSSPFWGRFADLSSRKVLVYSGILGGVAAAMAILFGRLPASLQTPYTFAAVIVLLGIAEAGAILGRKTYLIDNAEASERPTYVAFSNSIVGLAMLLLGGIGLAAHYAGVQTALAILAPMALAGSAAGMLLPEDAQIETLNQNNNCYPLQQCPSAAN